MSFDVCKLPITLNSRFSSESTSEDSTTGIIEMRFWDFVHKTESTSDAIQNFLASGCAENWGSEPIGTAIS